MSPAVPVIAKTTKIVSMVLHSTTLTAALAGKDRKHLVHGTSIFGQAACVPQISFSCK